MSLLNWPNKRPSLKEALFLIETGVSKAFTFEEVLKEVKAHCKLKNEQIEDHLKNLLTQSKNIGEALFDGKSVYYPGALLFEKARFLIRPTAQEIEYGALIAGHRFFPWVSSYVSFQEFNVFNQNEPLEKIYFETELSDLQEYFAFLPIEDTVTALIPSLSEEEETVFSTLAFDFSKYFDESHFQEGDCIEFTVQDYAKGDLSFRVVKGEALLSIKKELNEHNRLVKERIEADLQGRSLFEPPVKALLNIHAELFFLNGNSALPHDEWSEILHEMDIVNILYFQHRPFLVSSEKSQDEVLDELHDQLTLSDGRCETLDDLFEDYHLELEERVLEAYLRDALKEETFSREAFLHKTVQQFNLESILEEKPDIFLELFDEFLTRVQNTAAWILNHEKQNELRVAFLIKLERINDIAEGLFRHGQSELIEDVLPDLEAIRQGLVQVLEMLSHPVEEHELELIEKQNKELELMLASISKQMMYQLPNKSR